MIFDFNKIFPGNLVSSSIIISNSKALESDMPVIRTSEIENWKLEILIAQRRLYYSLFSYRNPENVITQF